MNLNKNGDNDGSRKLLANPAFKQPTTGVVVHFNVGEVNRHGCYLVLSKNNKIAGI